MALHSPYKEEEMRNFLIPLLTVLDEIKKAKYPNSFFYEKNGETPFELTIDHNKNPMFLVSFHKIWQFFYNEFGLIKFANSSNFFC